MVIPWGEQLCWWPGDLSIKARDNHQPSVVASWMGNSVPDEALLPSDRGERSETFSLGGGGYPRGIAKGCPLKTPKQPAKLRRVAFLGGAAPSRPKSRPGGRLASKRFAAARSKDTTFSRLTARKCCCHPRRGRAAEGIRPAALLWDMCLHCTQKNMDDTYRPDCRW